MHKFVFYRNADTRFFPRLSNGIKMLETNFVATATVLFKPLLISDPPPPPPPRKNKNQDWNGQRVTGADLRTAARKIISWDLERVFSNPIDLGQDARNAQGHSAPISAGGGGFYCFYGSPFLMRRDHAGFLATLQKQIKETQNRLGGYFSLIISKYWKHRSLIMISLCLTLRKEEKYTRGNGSLSKQIIM